MAFLDATGAVLIQVKYDARTVAGFRAAGARARRYVRDRALAARGDKLAAARFLGTQLDERQVDLAAARARRAKLVANSAPKDGDGVVDAVQLASLDQKILDLSVSTDMRRVGQRQRHTLGPEFFAMLRKGPRPSLHVSRGFYFAMLEHAERVRDVAGFREALAAMRRGLAATDPGKPWVPNLLARYEEKLEDLARDRR